MPKRSSRKSFRKAKATGIAAAVLASAIVPSMVVGLDTVEAAEQNVDEIAKEVTRGIYETIDYSIVYESNGETVKLLNLTKVKSGTLVLPNTIDGLPVTEIGAYFSANNPTIITSLTLPSQLLVIGDEAFTTSVLKTLTLPSNLQSIGAKAFFASQITNLTIPSTVKNIDYGAFLNSPLTTLTFKNGSVLERLGQEAFYKAQLTNLVLPSTVKYIDTYVFASSPLTSLELPSSLIKIGTKAFRSSKLTKLDFPSTIREIGEAAFEGVNIKLSNLTGHENIVALGVGYKNSYGTEGQDLGVNTEEIRTAIQAGYSTYTGDNYTLTYKEIEGEIYLTKLISVDGGSELVLPNFIDGKKVKHIASYFAHLATFKTNNEVTKLVLPEHLESVGRMAFTHFSSIKEMNYPTNLTSLDYSSFGDMLLTKLELPEGLEHIPDFAFYDSPLVELKLPSTLKTIGSKAFASARTLTSIDLPEGLEKIGSFAFEASPITQLTLPSTLEILSAGAFGLSNLDKLVVKNNFLNYYSANYSVTKTFGLNSSAVIYTDLGSTTRNLANINNYTLKPLDEVTPSTPILTKKEGPGTSKVFINMDSAVDHYEYSLNDGSSWTETTEREISLTEGATVQVRAYDSTGKVSPTASIEVNVLPKTELNSKKPMPNEIVVNKGDSLSLHYADYFEGDGLTVTTTLESETDNNLVFTGLNSMKDGQYTLSYTVSDTYGNEQTGTYNVVYLTDVQNTVKDFSLYAKQGGTVAFDVAPLLKMPSYSELSYEMRILSGAEGSAVTFTDGKLSVQNVSEGTSVFYLTVKNQFDQEASFTVNVHAVPNSSSNDSVLTKPTTNDAHTLNMFVEQDETQTIPLDGLVSSLDGELTYELTDTPAGVVEASVTGSSLTVKGLSKGYTTLNIKATDEDGDTVSLMVLVYVGSTKNSSTGESATIDDANIKANVGYYVVPLGEAFTDSSTSEVKQYGIEVTEKNEVADTQPVLLRQFTTASINPKPVKWLTTASLNPAPLRQVTTAPIVPTPEGVNSEVVFQDGSLQVDLVNDVLLIAGYEASEYTVKVTSYTEQGASAPKEFAVYVEGDDTGNGSGDSNGGSTGGNGSTGGSGSSNGGDSSTGDSGSSNGGSGSTGGSGSSNGGDGSTGGNGSSNGGDGSTGGNGSSNGGNGSIDGIDASESGDESILITIDEDKISLPADDKAQFVLEDDKLNLVVGEKTYTTDFKGPDSYENLRAVRLNRDGSYSTVPHYVSEDHSKLVITTNNPDNLLITSRVASNFTDTKGLYSEQEVEDLFNYVITTGTTATTYSPYQDITRSQFAVMIARALELERKGAYAFKDGATSWYASDVQALYEAGIITGYGDGTFGGGDKLTRQQAAAMIERMLRYMGVDTKVTENVHLADLNKVLDYAKPAVQFLAQHDILNHGEDVEFNPYNHLNRAQMAKMLMRSLRLSEWY